VVSSLVIENCRFEANRALATTSPEGSAVSTNNVALVVRDSVFIGNVGTGQLGNGGGALRVGGDRASAVIERCWFEGNESTGASALWLGRLFVPVDAPPDELRDLSFLSNTGHGGAALFQGFSTPRMPVRLRNCTFADNTGNLGTAMTLQSTSMEMHHCTISENTHQDRNGSAIRIPLDGNSDLLISRSVIAGNRHNFRVFSPDEASSNRWDAMFEVTARCSTAMRPRAGRQLRSRPRVTFLSAARCSQR
jgi:hypothetical protein